MARFPIAANSVQCHRLFGWGFANEGNIAPVFEDAPTPFKDINSIYLIDLCCIEVLYDMILYHIISYYTMYHHILYILYCTILHCTNYIALYIALFLSYYIVFH